MSSGYLSALINYWGNLATDSATRLQNASNLIQQGNYKPKNLLSDVLGFSMDAVDGWWSSLLLSASPPVPVCFLPAVANQTFVKGDVSVLVPPNAVLQWTDLVSTTGTISGVNSVSVTAPDSMTLTVQVENLDTANSGLYQGLAYTAARPLTQIFVLVP